MFETLNDRGLKTTQADLVKNYLFGRAGARIAEAQQKWAAMRGLLESLDEEDGTVTFLRHSLIALRGYLREAEVYEAVQSQANGEQPVITFLTILENLAQNYVAIFNPENEKWNAYSDSTRRAIEVLNLLDIRPLRPLMLAIATKFATKDADDSFSRLVSWAVRLVLASSTRSGSVEMPFASAAHGVMDGTIQNSEELRRRLLPTIPADEQFRASVAIASVSSAKLARYYLRSLEMAANEEPQPWFIPNSDRSAINLEHVLPLRPEGNWPQFSEESQRVYSRRLGNLALLPVRSNSELRSSDFSAKKAILQEAPYVLTKMIGEQGDWNGDAIEHRQNKLADLALKAWPL
jgi:hypothetical protein